MCSYLAKWEGSNQSKRQETLKFTSSQNLKIQWTYPKWIIQEMSWQRRNTSYICIPCQSLSFFSFFFIRSLCVFSLFFSFVFSQHDVNFLFFSPSTKLFFWSFFQEMKRKLQLLKGIGSLIINLQSNIYIHNPNRREPKQMFNIINPSTKQHTKATLNSIIHKTTHYIVILHKLGLKEGIYIWPRANMNGSQQPRI